MPAASSPLAALDVTGVYINLDRSTERRAHVERELARHGLAADYVRFAAVDGKMAGSAASPLEAGEIGCFRSHAGALRMFAAGDRHLHVAEDDIVFSSRFASAAAEVIRSGTLDKYDLIFLDTVVAVGLELVSEFRRLFERQASRAAAPVGVLDFCNHKFASTSSYLVNRRSVARVADLLEREIAAGPGAPLDLHYCRLMETDGLRVACVFPFVTSVRLESATATTIAGREGGDTLRFACDLLRYAFYVDCDWDVARRAIDAFAPALLSDPQDRIIGAALALATKENLVRG